MLGSIAFSITGIIVLLFASTIKRLLTKKRSTFIVMAYTLLALVFISYGTGAGYNDGSNLAFYTLIGNLLLASATVLMVTYRTKLSLLVSMTAGLFIGLFALLIRRTYFYPEPTITGDGVVIFNTQLTVAVFIAALFLLFWLPMNLAIAKEISEKIKMSEAKLIYSGLFTMMVCSAILFMSAKTSTGVILTFTIIAASFLTVSALNVVAYGIYKRSSHGK